MGKRRQPSPRAILLAISGWERSAWERELRGQAPDRDVRLWPEQLGDPSTITYACVWKPPAGLLKQLPALDVIFSLGAGVDHVFSDPELPGRPIVRIIDPDLTRRMTEYVVLNVLLHHRRTLLYAQQQRDRLWREQPQPAAAAVTVGIMGLGVLGRDAAEVLRRLGFRVRGLSRMGQPVAGVETFALTDRERFLAGTEILVCLLPLTPATKGILNLSLFRSLNRCGALGGAYLINAGRGALQNDEDIVRALEEDSLAGASLDVFATEPLPAHSQLWGHPRVVITPHVAAVSDPRALIANIIAHIERHEQGLPLRNRVDPQLGY